MSHRHATGVLGNLRRPYNLVQQMLRVDETKHQKNEHIQSCEKSTINARLFLKCTVIVMLKIDYQCAEFYDRQFYANNTVF